MGTQIINPLPNNKKLKKTMLMSVIIITIRKY